MRDGKGLIGVLALILAVALSGCSESSSKFELFKTARADGKVAASKAPLSKFLDIKAPVGGQLIHHDQIDQRPRQRRRNDRPQPHPLPARRQLRHQAQQRDVQHHRRTRQHRKRHHRRVALQLVPHVPHPQRPRPDTRWHHREPPHAAPTLHRSQQTDRRQPPEDKRRPTGLPQIVVAVERVAPPARQHK